MPSESGHAGKGCLGMDPRHQHIGKRAVGAGVLLIANALAFRLDGGLLGSRDRGGIGSVARLKVH